MKTKVIPVAHKWKKLYKGADVSGCVNPGCEVQKRGGGWRESADAPNWRNDHIKPCYVVSKPAKRLPAPKKISIRRSDGFHCSIARCPTKEFDVRDLVFLNDYSRAGDGWSASKSVVRLCAMCRTQLLKALGHESSGCL